MDEWKLALRHPGFAGQRELRQPDQRCGGIARQMRGQEQRRAESIRSFVDGKAGPVRSELAERTAGSRT